MKFTSILLLSFSALILSSCQKEISGDIDTPPVVSSNKLKSYTEDVTVNGSHQVNTFNIAYDVNDRMISLISASTPGGKSLYQYNSNTSFTRDIYDLNVLVYHVIFFLNSYSLIDSTADYFNANDTIARKYLYNSAKQLIQMKEYDYSGSLNGILRYTSSYTYDTNGNQINVSNIYSVTTFDYYDIINNLPVFPDEVNRPFKLIKTQTITSGSTTYITHHTYTYDSKNRISTDRREIEGEGIVVMKSYTYY